MKKAIGLGFVIVLGYLEIVGWEIPVVRAMVLVLVMYWAQILGRKYNLVRGIILGGLIIILVWPGSLNEASFWVSLWISLIIGLFFGKLNLIGPISNMLVALVAEMITVVGFIGTLVGLVILVLGKIVLWSVWPLLKYFAVVVEMMGNW